MFKHDVCVVGGAGHVGLPLSVVLADKNLDVLIYDLNDNALETIASGVIPFMEDDAEPLLRKVLETGKLKFSSDVSKIKDAKYIVVTIGTPVDEFHNPVLSSVRECVDALLPHLSDEQIIILRSTVYPGTTDWMHGYLRSKGKKTLVSFCPERIVQGQAIKELQELPQIVSGTTEEAEKQSIELFQKIAPEIVRLKPIEAEFAKLFNNAYRYIEFAVTNQFYMIANNAGVDYRNVLVGMKQNYPRAKNIPSPGFASGPCLFKDTMQLSSFSNNQFSIGHSAMLVNEGLPLYLCDQIERVSNLSEMTVGLLGMSFKSENDDTRSSLSYKLKKVMQFKAKEVLTTDPFVTTDKALIPLEQVIEKSDILILCVPHKAYKNIKTGGKPLFDIWNHVETEETSSTNSNKPRIEAAVASQK